MNKFVSKGSFISFLQYYSYLEHFISKEKEGKCCLPNKKLGTINCPLLTLKKRFSSMYVYHYNYNNFPVSWSLSENISELHCSVNTCTSGYSCSTLQLNNSVAEICSAGSSSWSLFRSHLCNHICKSPATMGPLIIIYRVLLAVRKEQEQMRSPAKSWKPGAAKPAPGVAAAGRSPGVVPGGGFKRAGNIYTIYKLCIASDVQHPLHRVCNYCFFLQRNPRTAETFK